MSVVTLSREDLGDFDRACDREWLVTNGIGGFASGTVGGANTRRYHGLLVAALRPPVQRTLLVSSLDIIIDYHGRTFELASHEYSDGTVNPHGYRLLESFELEGQIPLWRFTVADASVDRRIWMMQGSNTTFLQLRLTRASAPMTLRATPLCIFRDYHSQNRGALPDYSIRGIERGFEFIAWPGATPCSVTASSGEFQSAPDWHWNVWHRLEATRGLDASEDLLQPGQFVLTLQAGDEVTFCCSSASKLPMTPGASLSAAKARVANINQCIDGHQHPAWIQQLAIAADQFLVRRPRPGSNSAGSSIIAGYHWFSDWGRDAMIALPGLALCTGRFDDAAEILRTFAGHASDGMLPNRFPDGDEQPEYNTVDATLWYFDSVWRYHRRSGDASVAAELYPLLKDIVDWHVRGTRFGIHVDPADGLLAAGQPGVQLTWMDAKVDDWVVTPRSGKAVEINALWIHALRILAALSQEFNDRKGTQEYHESIARAVESFRSRFWYAEGGYLYDLIDQPDSELPDGVDRSLRPNQIFAVSLPFRLLDHARGRSVVDICARELYTGVGLRSLSPRDPAYVGRYEGGVRQRDAAYHQGTVWGWLAGPFALAHFSIYGDTEVARSLLRPMASHLRDAGLGSISEIFDGDPPHKPRGCIAQAWSVAEVLRAWLDLGGTSLAKDNDEG